MVVNIELDNLFLSLAEMLLNQFVVLIHIVSSEILHQYFKEVAFFNVVFVKSFAFALLFLVNFSLFIRFLASPFCFFI